VPIIADGLRAFMEIARAGVITEARPHPHNLLGWRAGKIADSGESFAKRFPIGCGVRDRGLLQHNFRQPDAVRVGVSVATLPVFGTDAPWEGAAFLVIPTQERSTKRTDILICNLLNRVHAATCQA